MSAGAEAGPPEKLPLRSEWLLAVLLIGGFAALVLQWQGSREIAQLADAQIVFTRNDVGSPYNQAIYLMNLDGTNLTRLVDTGAEPSWSPDGSRIAYSSIEGIRIVDADGTNDTLLNGTSPNQGSPDWAPDGNKLTLVTQHEEGSEIYTVNLDGSGAIRLTENGSADVRPVWSPNGTKIAFETDRDGNFLIYTMNPDGTDQTPLFEEPIPGVEAAWSPSGDRIAFFEFIQERSFAVATARSDGTGHTRLTDDDQDCGSPAWSSDGKWIAYSCYPDREENGNGFFVMKSDGSDKRPIPNGSSSDNEADWRPIAR